MTTTEALEQAMREEAWELACAKEPMCTGLWPHERAAAVKQQLLPVLLGHVAALESTVARLQARVDALVGADATPDKRPLHLPSCCKRRATKRGG